MVQLFLSTPTTNCHEKCDAVKDRISLLEKLESIIWSLITSGGGYEARTWFCNTISCIHTITPRDHCDLFLDLLRSKKLNRDVSAQILRMFFEKRPEKVGPILAKKSYILEIFFEGNPRRILQWFDHFASSNDAGHKKGARAIAQFAFVNRDTCWEELEWKGKHGQSPAVVATKPHYFYDLDVLKTVENFLEYVPDFWTSDEFAESVKDGDILNIDMKYFVDQFIHWMHKENLEDIWEVVEDFLMEAEFSVLSQQVLILLDENSLLTFLKSVSKLVCPNVNCKEYGYPSCWLENILSKPNDFMSLDDFLLLNAIVNQGRQLLRIVRDEEHAEEKNLIDELLKNAVAFTNEDHWSLLNECKTMKDQMATKYLGLHSWIIHYYLSRDCITPESWELMFVKNGISFHKSYEYSLVRSDGFAKGYSSGSGGEDSARKSGYKKRKRERKKRRRKKHDHEENNCDELLVFENGLQSRGSSWFLSTDGYSCAWNTADLPDHLSRHCFVTWMRWISSNSYL